jgi:hypothetical protein
MTSSGLSRYGFSQRMSTFPVDDIMKMNVARTLYSKVPIVEVDIVSQSPEEDEARIIFFYKIVAFTPTEMDIQLFFDDPTVVSVGDLPDIMTVKLNGNYFFTENGG